MKTIRINTDKQTMMDQYREFSPANQTNQVCTPLDRIRVVSDDTKEEHIMVFSQAAHCAHSCSVRRKLSSHPDFNSICYLTGCDRHTGGGYIEPAEILEEL